MNKRLLIVLFTLFGAMASFKSQALAPNINSKEVSFENQVDYVDFMFTDILGHLRSVTLPVNQVPGAIKNGLKFDGSSIPGYSSIYESDMHLKADTNTAVVITRTDGSKHGRILCDVYRSETEKYEGDPRSILKEHLAKAHELGYEFLVGPELEFFLFTGDSKAIVPIDSNRYFEAENCLNREKLKKELLSYLEQNHIRVEKLHHEVAPGQHEISIEYADALTMADQIILAKHAICAFAAANGMKASFMPKPICKQNGSGMHVHFSLYDTKNQRNAFYDSKDADNLSDTAHQFIAGVLSCIPETNAFINSTVNSYKRLVAGYEAPVYLCWATKNRSALIRIPQINASQPQAARAELRSPDAMTNPYILLSLILSAGLDGIANKKALAPAVNENLYKISLDQIKQRGIKTLPASLNEALANLEKSEFASRALGDRLKSEFLKIKQKELEQFNLCITDWELQQYL